MGLRLTLFFFSLFILFQFTLLSYSVAKEEWQKTDFDTTVKIQDHIPKIFDDNFSLLSLLGSVEVTVGFCLIMIALALLRLKWFAVLGWLIIIPASAAEVFGKLILYHPGPPLLFHRTTLVTHLPSFYIQTDFSYPSGHMTRAVFIATVLFLLALFSKINFFLKYIFLLGILILVFLMGLTRVSLGEHWLSDVLGGSLLGTSFGLFAYLLILGKKKV